MRLVVRLLLATSVASFFAVAPSLARAAVPTNSCAAGAPSVSVDRKLAINGGRSIEVIYAHPADVTDSFGTMAHRIATDVATGHTWLLREDPGRAFRFDLFPFAGCTGDIANLDIADVALPEGTAAYASLSGRFQRLVSQLRGAPFGFNSAYKKYIVYLDAAVGETDVCGQGGGNPNGQGYAFIYMRTCQQNVGDGGLSTVVAFHELLHSFGLVDDGAPHQCPAPDDGHTCDNRQDILYPYTFGDPIERMLLDPGRDDYWGHNGAWIDGRRSGFLIKLDAPRHQVSVAITGGGSGIVESDLPGISCAATCSTMWDQGESLTLTATAGDGARFVGFTGACTTQDTRCTVPVDSAKAVTATFAREVGATRLLRISRAGKGTVTSSPSGISCPSRCSASFAADAAVRLAAKPAKGYRFAGWTGACRGRGTCSVTLDADKSVKATFKRR